MSFSFKIWDQSHDKKTMAIRAKDVSTVDAIAMAYEVPSDDQLYASLGDFLEQLRVASDPLPPYRKTVDVFWNTGLGYDQRRLFGERILEATYTGPVRQSGGFSAQYYVMIDPEGYESLKDFHHVVIRIEILPGDPRDMLVVTV